MYKFKLLHFCQNYRLQLDTFYVKQLKLFKYHSGIMLDYHEIRIYFSDFILSYLNYEISKRICFTIYSVKE